MSGRCDAWRGCNKIVNTICFACGLPICTEHSQKMEWFPKLFKRQPKRICEGCLEDALNFPVSV